MPTLLMSPRRRHFHSTQLGGGGSSTFTPDFYVSPSGSSANPGTLLSPWSLAYAIIGAAGTIQPGHKIGLLAGTYTGQFVITVSGNASAPVIFRAMPGQRVTLDSNVGVGSLQESALRIAGNYVWVWGIESTNSDTNRTSIQDNSSPTDMNSRSFKEFKNAGHHNKIINCVIHEAANGMVDQSQDTAWATEWYGNLVYNIGWVGPGPKGYGHIVYTQNLNPLGKQFTNNVGWNSGSTGIQLFGSDAASILYFTLTGNAISQCGWDDVAWNKRLALSILGGTALTLGLSNFINNHFYTSDGLHANVQLNQQAVTACQSMTYTGNRANGQCEFNECLGHTITGNKFSLGNGPPAGVKPIAVRRDVGQAYGVHTINNNSYAVLDSDGPFYDNNIDSGGGANALTFAQWKSTTGWDASSTELNSTLSSFTGADVVVQPNFYEPGRGHVICWNWDSASSLAVDLSTILSVGDNYTIHHVYNVFGSPVVSGTYAGGTVSILQTGYVPPVGIGALGAPPTTSPRFNVFLVRKV